MKNSICFILFLPILLNGCTPYKIPNHPINNDLKNAFNYQVGTYWVYKDSVTGALDSFFVSKNSFIQLNETSYTVDAILIDLNNLNISSDRIGISLSDNGLVIDFPSYKTLKQPFISPNNPPAKSFQYGPLIYYPFALGNILSTGYVSDSGVLTAVNTTLQIGNNKFNNVSIANHFNTQFDISQNYFYSDWLYMNADVGVIKMVFDRPTDSIKKIWELQRWKIVK